MFQVKRDKIGILEQIKDILPSFTLSAIMAMLVYAISFIPMSVYVILPIQLLTGAAIIFGFCELSHMEEYEKIKESAIELINKRKGNGQA